MSLYLLGAKPGVAEQAAEKLAAQYHGLKIAGTHDGYFKEDGPIVEAIAATGADCVFVCLGAPKQERWMAAHRGALPGIMLGVGAAFDYEAGNIQRAPLWMQRCSLEWLYRLMQDPVRLLPRYLQTNLRYIWLTKVLKK